MSHMNFKKEKNKIPIFLNHLKRIKSGIKSNIEPSDKCKGYINISNYEYKPIYFPKHRI
jgi:hypothetical protein